MINLDKELSVQRLIDISLGVGMVPDAKFHYKWHEYAKWQFQILVQIGLKPEHKLLDIGCGPLRFGMEAINYLNDGGYYGIDGYKLYIELGSKLVEEVGLNKKYRVIEDGNFGFSRFNEKFDFANSQSVFTHLSREQVVTALRNSKEVMRPGGVLLFTNIEAGFPRGFLYASRHPMCTGINMNEKFYQSICDELGLKLEYNAVEHPTQGAHLIKY
jgi:cyclopropane fatty-acyl-phospholipid synthase-like methyltransferase